MKESLNVLLILILIIPLIAIVVYILKRIMLPKLAKTKNKPLQITYQLSIGSKERLICVDVDGTTLLLGATPNNISLLHVMPKKTNDLEDCKLRTKIE